MLIFKSHWSLEEASGLRTDDADGNHLTPINEAGRRPGKINYATNFRKYVDYQDGSLHTRLEIKEGSELDTDTFSAFTWFHSDVPFTDNFLMARRSDDYTSWAIRIAFDKLRFETSGDNNIIDVQYIDKPTIQQDHMVGISYNATTKRKVIFFDGVLYESTAWHTNHLYTSNTAFTLGAMSGGGRNFDGWLDQTGFLPLEITEEDWIFIWNNGDGRSWEEYGLFSRRLHQKLQLVTMSFDVPDEYTACIPGEAERDAVEGTSKEQPFNPDIETTSDYTGDVPNEYIGILPGEYEGE